MSRHSLIARVHIAKKELSLTDDTYRAALALVSNGKTSCSAMSEKELASAIAHFKNLGWSQPSNKKRQYSPKTRNATVHDQIDKIRALWITMYKTGAIDNGTELALDAFVKRTTARLNNGEGIARTEWLRGKNKNLANTVLESLKQWQRRVENGWRNEDLKAVSLEQQRTDQTQAAVVEQLLQAHAIFWWPLFSELGLEKSNTYCTNRRELNHG